MEEVWKDVEGYEGFYQVSNLGRVKSLGRIIVTRYGKTQTIYERVLKIKIHKFGYLEVSLHSNGKSKTYKVHRLVAEAFIPNPDGLLEVNHIDENKSNNRVDNLEWCSSSYNANYGTRNKRVALAKSKKIIQYSLDGVLIKEHQSLTDAGRTVNGNAQGVFLCVNDKIKKYKGYIWKYKI